MNKIIILFTLSITLFTGCDDGTTDVGDWSEFEKFTDMETSGEVISCNDLVGTRMTRALDFGETADVGILDFIYINNYTFVQCKKEIEMVKKPYCSRRMDAAIFGMTRQKRTFKQEHMFWYFCEEEWNSEIVNINFSIKMPNSESRFLVIDAPGIMILPSEIERITFGTVKYEHLWRIKLHTNRQEVISLYYGRKDLYESAKVKLSKL